MYNSNYNSYKLCIIEIHLPTNKQFIFFFYLTIGLSK